jgi:serine/threonine protein kinase
MTLTTGQVLNYRYRIVKSLGQGGFATVYRAWDINKNLACALKENNETTPEAARQFAREANILAKLRHPNLPRVIDYFIISGYGQYLVMELVEGDDLQTMLERLGRPFPMVAVMRWSEHIFDALAYLHSQQPPVIHRDIKPANIKITPQGKVMLLDFGISKFYDPTSKTTMGARAISPGYSPPEQYGSGITNARSDIYALGATLYTLLTAQTPPDSVEILTGSAPSPVPVHVLNQKVSSATSAVIERALRIQSDKRWQVIADFKTALLGSLAQQGQGAQVSISAGVKHATPSLVSVDELDPDRYYTFVCPECGEFDETFQIPEIGQIVCSSCDEQFDENDLAYLSYGSLIGEHSLGCPHCGNFADAFHVPELGLARCPNCNHTYPATELQAIESGNHAGIIDFGCPDCGELNEEFQIPDFGDAICSACDHKYSVSEIQSLSNGRLAGDRRFTCPKCNERDENWHVPEYGAAKCSSCDEIFPPAELAKLSRRRKP